MNGMQTVDDLEAIIRVCADAGIQLMDGEWSLYAPGSLLPFGSWS